MTRFAVKRIIFFAGIVFLMPFSAMAGNTQPLTFSDCYDLALKKSEAIAIDAQVIKEAEAHFLQALGDVLPHVTYTLTSGRQDVGPHSESRGFVFKQNLFSGFKEFAAMSGSQMEKNQRMNEKARAEQLLLVDVADAFYLFISEERDLKVLASVRLALLERLKSLNKRLQLGRSRPSELVNTEAQLYQVEAEMETAKTQELVARQLLEYLIGRPIDKITDANIAFPTLSESVGHYLLKADTRPDVLASRQAQGVAKKREFISRTDLLPNANLEYDYYTSRKGASGSSASSGGDWNALVTVNIPIFEGTTIFGNIKEAHAQAVESELGAQQVRRSAVLDIRQSYSRLSKAIDRTKAMRKVVRAAEMSYMLQKKDYDLSLVNNLEVLASIQTVQQSWRDYIQAYYETKRLFWELRAATGETIPGR